MALETVVEAEELQQRVAGRLGGRAKARLTASGPAKQWLGREEQRDQLIRRLRSRGASLAEIAREFGLSRQRIHQIVSAAA